MIRLKQTISTFLLLIVVAVVGVAGLSLLPSGVVVAQSIQDNSDNSIIKGGVSSASDFATKARANNPSDLQDIYTKFNLPPDKYDDFARDAKTGTAKRNGDIVVDGKTVARNSWSIGRTKFSYSTDYKIGNTTYYKSNSTDVMKQDLPVLVWFNSQGKIQAAVLMACGNPMGGAVAATITQTTQPAPTTPKPAPVAPVATPTTTAPTSAPAPVAAPAPAPPVAAPAPAPVQAIAAPAPQVELPKTGPADVIGLFAAASIAGTLGYYWWTRRRIGRIDQLVNSLKS